jgi:hypothetical protein
VTAAVGRIERVPLREVWRHEAHHLTRWLEENADVLHDVLGFTLTIVDRERQAGAFNVDLVAEDDGGRTVVIENQLERSDHDHLGKIITYTAMVDAQVAIWIVAEPRAEHVRAVSWLNDSSATDFWLLKIEGIRIGDSPPAPLLTLIVGPSEEGKRAGEVKKELAESAHIRRRFWTELLDLARERTRLHSGISPTDDSWVSASAGKTGLGFNYSVTQHAAQVELYIDRGRGANEQNLAIFNELLVHKEQIERAYGGRLEWQPLDERRACRIRERWEGVGYRDEDQWAELQAKLIDAMIRLEGALRPFIARLAI